MSFDSRFLLVLPLVLAPRVADACEPLPWNAEVVIPPADVESVPRDGALIALITTPSGTEGLASLTRVDDGSFVPVGTSLRTTVSSEQALLRASASVPLEPDTQYQWTIDGVVVPFTTGEMLDPAIPTPGELQVIELGPTTVIGCFGWEEPVEQFELVVPDLAEPVAVVAVGPSNDLPESYVLGTGSSVVVTVPAGEEACYEVMIGDYGGHYVSAGTTCVQASIGGSSSGGQDTGTDETGDAPADGSTTSPVDSGTTGGDDGTGSGAADDGATDRGCACHAEPHDSGGWWSSLLLLPLLRRRRRLSSSTIPACDLPIRGLATRSSHSSSGSSRHGQSRFPIVFPSSKQPVRA